MRTLLLALSIFAVPANGALSTPQQPFADTPPSLSRKPCPDGFHFVRGHGCAADSGSKICPREWRLSEDVYCVPEQTP